jgi:hypothetical protein
MITDKITDGCDGRNHLLRSQFHKSVEILSVSILVLGQSLEGI